MFNLAYVGQVLDNKLQELFGDEEEEEEESLTRGLQTGPKNPPDLIPYMSRAPGATPQRCQAAQAEFEDLLGSYRDQVDRATCLTFSCFFCTCGTSVCCCLIPMTAGARSAAQNWSDTYPLEALEVRKASFQNEIPELPAHTTRTEHSSTRHPNSAVPEPSRAAVQRRKAELGLS